MIYQPTWNQHDSYYDIEANDQIPHPLRVVINFAPSRARKGIKCPWYAYGGGGGVVEASIRLVHYLTWLSTLIEKLIKPYRIAALSNTGKSAIRERSKLIVLT